MSDLKKKVSFTLAKTVKNPYSLTIALLNLHQKQLRFLPVPNRSLPDL
jgi:hypothetical protein